MSEPSNLPLQPSSPHPVWDRFSADPRTAGTLRATDADRDVARTVIAEAYADGRLDDEEMSERIDRAMAVRELQEMPLLLGDLVPEQQPSGGLAPSSRGSVPERRRGAVLPAGAGTILMLNAIWLITCLSSGKLLYYWPIWPMLPVLFFMFTRLRRN